MGNGRFWVFSGVGFGSVSDDMTSSPSDVLSVAVYKSICADLIALFRQPNNEQECCLYRVAPIACVARSALHFFSQNGARFSGRTQTACQTFEKEKSVEKIHLCFSTTPVPKRKHNPKPHITMTTTDQRRSRRP